jgi:organic radical activating enzyme
MKLHVCEIFQAIQGEGKYVGTNVIFLRLSGCNLNCSFCDTKYHWSGKDMELKDVAEEIKKFNSKKIVITGGEPLSQQQALTELFQENLDSSYHITVETNGTIMPDKIIPYIDHYACSPKLGTSGNDIDKRLDYDVLEYINSKKDSIFKFVISSDEDLDEVKFIENQVQIDKEKIYLMKEGGTTEKQYHGIANFLDVCLKNGYNFSPRLHVMIYDIKRGV